MLHGPARAVTPQIIQVPLPGTSAILLLDERVTVIDAGLRGSERRILRALRDTGRSADEIEQVVITHNHFDHAGGLRGLLQHTAARVGVHVADAPILEGRRSPSLTVLGVAHLKMPAAVLPPVHVDTLLKHDDELPVLGGMRVIHTPGHTAGHIALHLPHQGVLIAGDLMQVRRGQRLDPSARRFSDDRTQAIRSLDLIGSLDFDILMLNHFAPVGAAHRNGDAKARVQALIARYRSQMDAGSGR